VADEGGTESPQPRHWRAKLTREKRVTFQACLAKQAREWQCGKVFYGLPHQRARWFAMTEGNIVRIRRGEAVKCGFHRRAADSRPYGEKPIPT